MEISRLAAAFLMVAALPWPAAAADGPFDRDFGLVEAPACKSLMGMDVRFVPVTKAELEGVGQRYGTVFILGVAHPSPMVPLVIFDHETLRKTPHEFQRQILLHECAHKSHGFGGSQPEEDAADCEAAKRLRAEFGYGAKEFETIVAYTRHILEREEIPEAQIRPKLRAVAACAR
ncbi:MAG: hypothetical protein HY078_09035 [Elusimicrobia bacterium]|nr:hypothetical protein [Elusimicrobiota bacterium]